jgi:hypothetical protein
VILLLLVVVAQLSLTLSRHPTLRLSHLIRIVRSRRIALVLVETLDVRGRVGARAVVLAHGMVALRAAHTLLYNVHQYELCKWRQECVPYSGNWRGAGPPPTMGIDSRRPAPVCGNPGPNGFPLLARFSAARSISVADMLASALNLNACAVTTCAVTLHTFWY